ncbi:MAG: hypothetical protein GXP42_01990 [Chloroflexi bacterium]|nr:hypothetical protein [Chloroflexota bacterium]
MTRSRLLTSLWGLLFVLFGVVGLLFTFGALDDYKLILSYAVSITLALAGLVYLSLMLYQKNRWDYAIPGFSLLASGRSRVPAHGANDSPGAIGRALSRGHGFGFSDYFPGGSRRALVGFASGHNLAHHRRRGPTSHQSLSKSGDRVP